MEAVNKLSLFELEKSFPSIYLYIFEQLVWHIMYLPVCFFGIQTSKRISRP